MALHLDYVVAHIGEQRAIGQNQRPRRISTRLGGTRGRGVKGCDRGRSLNGP
jgi:hypothetical protein